MLEIGGGEERYRENCRCQEAFFLTLREAAYHWTLGLSLLANFRDRLGQIDVIVLQGIVTEAKDDFLLWIFEWHVGLVLSDVNKHGENDIFAVNHFLRRY